MKPAKQPKLAKTTDFTKSAGFVWRLGSTGWRVTELTKPISCNIGVRYELVDGKYQRVKLCHAS